MYCPKCGAVLEEDPQGWLRCSSGQLEFSIDVSRKLRATYGDALGGRVNTPHFAAGAYFCPGCGIAIPKGTDVCASCGISLRPLKYALIERHPHGDGTGKY